MAACGRITFCAVLFVAVATLHFMPSADATYSRRGHRRNSSERGRPTFGNGRSLVSFLMNLDQRLKVVERSGCDSDSLNISVCQNSTDTECFIAEQDDDASTVIEVPVIFKPTFASVPAVVAGLAGANFVTGEEITVQSQNITAVGFTIAVISRGQTPSRLNVFWIACNKAMD